MCMLNFRIKKFMVFLETVQGEIRIESVNAKIDKKKSCLI